MKIKHWIKSAAIAAAFAASYVSAADEVKIYSPEEMKTYVVKLLPAGEVVDEITDAPIDGFYQVVHGPRLFYISKDGKYMMQAKIFDVEKREEISENRLRQARIDSIERVAGDSMITYAPKPPMVSQHTITVFTDIDCGYCRKLHSEMKQYNDKGITVRYLFFPRAGMNSQSAKKAISVWCADDQHKAMDDAKLENKIALKDCKNNIAEQYQLGQQMGVRGTPALITDQGNMIPGYVPAASLLQRLNAAK